MEAPHWLLLLGGVSFSRFIFLPPLLVPPNYCLGPGRPPFLLNKFRVGDCKEIACKILSEGIDPIGSVEPDPVLRTSL